MILMLVLSLLNQTGMMNYETFIYSTVFLFMVDISVALFSISGVLDRPCLRQKLLG